MRCIWREQEKDDIGIDGEIELCRERPDGQGMWGTGKIVKVQSKSGSRYVIRDEPGSFASPVEEKDLNYWRGLNVPALYVVYHPDDDCLYWKHVQGYLKARPEAFQSPFRIEFDKGSDRFDKQAYATLEALCELAPERVLTDKPETLFSNLLPALKLPEAVFVAPVLPEKQPSFHDRIRGDQPIPPYYYSSGLVTTLADPANKGTALTNVIDSGGVESFSLDDWLLQDADENENRLKALLNSTLHRHLRRRGLAFLKSHRRYFFNEGLAEDAPLTRFWKNSRTGREQSRLVAKYYEYGRNKFYRHSAIDARFERFGDCWAIILKPKIHFSTDGFQRWEGRQARSYAIKARAEEWNNLYLNNLLFWSYQLSGGQDTFELLVGENSVATISGVPVSVVAPFSIETTGSPDRRVARAAQ